METIIGGEASSDASTSDGEEDIVIHVEEIGYMVQRECKWINFTCRILHRLFMADKHRWPVLITYRSARYCYMYKNALSMFGIDPTTHADVIALRNDFKIFSKILMGEFLHRVPGDAKYFKFIPKRLRYHQPLAHANRLRYN